MSRSFVIDTLKLVASQVIVWHHLVAYTPMAQDIRAAWPHLMDLVFEQGRWLVHAFLVISGYLAASGFMASDQKLPIWSLALKRYLRLMPLFVVSLLLVVIAGALARPHMQPDWLSSQPSFSDIVLHLTLLFDVWGSPSLTAGAWYVAIDFQLYLLLAIMVYSLNFKAQGLKHFLLPCGMALTTVSAIYVFSRNPDLDIWAVYFMSSYGLGCLSAWAVRSRMALCWWMLVLVLGLADLFMDMRGRQAVALMTSVMLFAGAHWKPNISGFWTRLTAYWSQASYALFVSHFAVIIMAALAWHQLKKPAILQPVAWAWFALLLTWVGALAMAALLHRLPIAQWFSSVAKGFWGRVSGENRNPLPGQPG
jgi:peptidoglycan/LPS O-acetylase OafA/YrhL